MEKENFDFDFDYPMNDGAEEYVERIKEEESE